MNNEDTFSATTITVLDSTRAKIPTCTLLVDGQIYWKLTEYFRERNFGVESERAYALALSRLMNWLSASTNIETRTKPTDNTINPDTHQKFTKNTFNAFLHDLKFGTIKQDGDPLNLWWKPASGAVVNLTSHRIAEFSDWLSAVHETTPINPKDRFASVTEQIISAKRFARVKSNSLLGHVKSTADALEAGKRTRRIATPGRTITTTDQVAAFPIEHIDKLLWKGFQNEDMKTDPRPWVRWNLRDILITLICLYGGCRESEPMHLWVDDVYLDPIDPESCQVLIHEPEMGQVDHIDPMTGKPSKTTRSDYLTRFCGGKRPLTQESGRRHAGWKGCLLTERKRKAFHVFWIDAQAGHLFKEIWSLYIQHARPVQPKTPWAFLTRDGQPMGSLGYIDNFKRAVEKIGLDSAKWNGTTPHGLRHRYGQWLNELGVESKHGQVCMHHASIASQDVYRTLTPNQVTETLRLATSPNRPTITSLPFEQVQNDKFIPN